MNRAERRAFEQYNQSKPLPICNMSKKDKLERFIRINEEATQLMKDFDNPSKELIQIRNNEDPVAYEELFKNKYQYLFKELPSLFFMIISRYPIEPNHVNNMYTMIYTRSLDVLQNEHDYNEKDLEVQKELSAVYIDPLIEKMEPIKNNEPRFVINGKPVNMDNNLINQLKL